MQSPVEQIKQRLSVADVVQSYIKLDKAGANYKARCPFHSEKTPSFFVSPSRDIWHCFGCSRGGDIFGFVMEIEGVEFIEALKILAERAGIKLQMEDPRLRNERDRILDLMKAATDFYRNQLNQKKDALDYLCGRGLKDSTIQSYFLGYAPQEINGWRNLYEFLLNKGYSDDEIEKSGMVVKADSRDKRYYDRFRGRIMFPIFDFSGRVVAFSGRLFPEDSQGPSLGIQKDGPLKAKYINSPQTILYDKSRILYGFDRAKTEIRKKDACVLVEGQMDILMSHQAEVLNAVAVSGTGLTPQHLDFIGRLTGNLIVSFDSDEAGMSGAGRGIDLALSRGFEVRVVALPFGKDPADVASKDPAGWQKSVGESRPIIDFYLKTLSEKISDSRELKRQVEKIVLPYASFIESEIDKNHWVKEIAKCLNIAEEPIWEQMKKLPAKKIKIPSTLNVDGGGGGAVKPRRKLLEERLLGLAFWQNNVNIIPDKILNDFSDTNKLIFQKFFPREKSSVLIAEEKKLSGQFSLEAELWYVGKEAAALEKEAAVLASEFERETIKEELGVIIEKIRKLEAAGDEKMLNVALSQFNELSQKFNQIKNEIKKI